MVLERSTEDRIAEVMYPAKITKGVADRFDSHILNIRLKALNLTDSLTITESYLVYLPFWRFTAQGLAVACGHSGYTERSGNKLRNEYEELVNEEYTWTKCACDTGQYGIKELWLEKGGEVQILKNAGDAFGVADNCWLLQISADAVNAFHIYCIVGLIVAIPDNIYLLRCFKMNVLVKAC